MGPVENPSPAAPAGPAVVFSDSAFERTPRSTLASSTERKLSPERRNSAPTPSVVGQESLASHQLVRNHSDPFKITSNGLRILSDPVPSSLTESQIFSVSADIHSHSLSSTDSDDDEETLLYVPDHILKSLPAEVLPVQLSNSPSRDLVFSGSSSLSLVEPSKFEQKLAEAVSDCGTKVENAVALLAASTELKSLPSTEQMSISHILIGILSELQNIRVQMERQTEILSKPVTMSRGLVLFCEPIDCVYI